MMSLVLLPSPSNASLFVQEGDPQAQADALFDEGLVLTEAYEFEAALAKFEGALPLYQLANDRGGEGSCWEWIGYSFYELSEYDSSLHAYEASLSIWREIRDQEGEAATLREIGMVYVDLAQYQQAGGYLEQALAIARGIGNRPEEVKTLNNLGLNSYYLGEYRQALDHSQDALAIAREIGDQYEQGKALNRIGLVYLDLAQYQQALDHFQQALVIAEEMGALAGQGHVLHNIAWVHKERAEFQQALDSYHQALAILQEIGDVVGEVGTFTTIGHVHYALGRYEEALEYYEQALAISREVGLRAEEGVALHSIARVYLGHGQYQQALETFQQVLAIQQEIGPHASEGRCFNSIGLVYDELGEYEQALHSLQQALAIAQAFEDRAGEGTALNNMGRVYVELGEHQQALETYRKALAIWQAIGDRLGQSVTLAHMGYLYEGQGDTAQAISHHQQAIEIVESIQGEIKVEELKASFAGKQVTAYERLINLLWQEGRVDEAFDYAERARARAFLDQFGNQRVDFRQGAAPELIEEEQALRQQIIGLEDSLTAERGRPLDQQRQPLLETLSKELEQARDDYQKLLIRLKLESPEYASLVSVSSLSLEEVQDQVLDEDTTLVEYFVLDDQTLAWVIDQDGFELVALEIGRNELHNRVEFLRDLIAIQGYDPQVAAVLHDALFAPLKPHIHHANLVIVPHGVLHYLPFAALWDAEAEHYLVEDYAVTYAPSASVLQYILDKRNADDGRLLAMGNPDGSLPYAAAEAEGVAELYDSAPLLGPEATESQVYAQAGEVDLLHLAAHGVYNPYNALYSRIELAPDDTQDGNLEVHEVFGLDLTGANLVVLSACETALGDQSEGDELVGLTRAFVYAGTPAVLTTQWSVDDAASGALMEAFYGHLREGLTNAEALRAAQLAVMAQQGWGDPYYWAAFGLTGDYLGSGEPGMGMAETPEPTVTPATVQTPTPVVEPSPTPRSGGGGLCAGAALPLGLVLLGGIQHTRMRRRDGS
jgi:CHAT domain-containing protein/Tfp pilus assembly protein PilF